MLDLDVRIDTDLRDRAVNAVDEFTTTKRWPVSRTQIAGLVQITSNEPAKLSEFAGNQKERAQKRIAGMRENDPKAERFGDEVDFWTLVVNLCVGVGAAQPQWSLSQLREKDLPDRLKLSKKPHPSAPREERDGYDRLKREKGEWERQWNRAHYPSFFRHFCAHYLHHMPLEKRD